jgi:MSHA pilin protein MshC
MRQRCEPRLRPTGFTLAELVMVLIIAAILAAVAVSRINTAGFDTEGYANRAAAMVRYAQRLAISQRRTVAVVVTAGTPGTLKLCYTDTACSGGDVREPPGTDAFQHTSKAGIGVAGSSFTFNALGRPSGGGTITVTGDGTKTITIAAETGYVQYEP